MVTTEMKQKILAGIKERRANYASDARMSQFIGISNAQYSRVMKGEFDRVLSDANWIHIARKLDIALQESMRWEVVETETYKFIYNQLGALQKLSVSGILCDMAGIGKTFASRQYVKAHQNAVYIDCSQCKSKQRLIRTISKEFGLGDTGRYADVYENLVFYLKSQFTPLIVLDEAGDLEYSAFLELKALWNATENFCGWYMMGADGLKAKIQRMIANKKVGYAELFRRYGENYKTIVPSGKEEREEFLNRQVAAVARANGVSDLQRFVKGAGGSLTRAYIEIKKIRVRQAA